MIGLQVPDHRFDRLATLEPLTILVVERLHAPPVNDAHPGVVGINAPIAQVDEDLFGHHPHVLQQDRRLLELLAQHVTVSVQTATFFRLA